MVERGRTPTCSRMAGGAGCAQRALLYVILGVAGGALRGNPFELVIDMATRARHRLMLPDQLENGQVVVESCLGPIRRSVAFTAVLTQIPLMNIVLGVAG